MLSDIITSVVAGIVVALVLRALGALWRRWSRSGPKTKPPGGTPDPIPPVVNPTYDQADGRRVQLEGVRYRKDSSGNLVRVPNKNARMGRKDVQYMLRVCGPVITHEDMLFHVGEGIAKWLQTNTFQHSGMDERLTSLAPTATYPWTSGGTVSTGRRGNVGLSG